MARPPLATIADLEEALAIEFVVGSPEEIQATTLLERASAIVRAYAGELWLDETETTLEDVPPDIPGVVVSVVERASRNPEGIVQETTGPFSFSFGAEAAQRLFLTAVDKLVIRAAVPGRRKVGTLPTTRGPLETPDVREDVLGADDLAL